jgi:hypothetical protein
MTDASDNNDIEDNDTGKTGKSGETGRAGGSGGGMRLPPGQLKEVMANWKYLDANEIAARVSEFFSELPARASAHVQVSWANIQNQGHAIITQVLKYAKEVSRLMHDLTRENIEILKTRYNYPVGGPSG